MALFARIEHGGYPVTRLPERGIQIAWPSGVTEYRSSRQALIALVNRSPTPGSLAYDPHTTFDRYFRLGKYQREAPPEIDIFDLIAMPRNEIAVYQKPPLVVAPDESLSAVRSGLGIDLDKRAKEVRKLFFAGFARKVIWMGYDPEDVLQEVYLGIMVRNEGKCPFDPEKASFGHYVHMVSNCILSNYRRRYSRLERNEVFGHDDKEGEVKDVAASDLAISPPLDASRLHMTDEISTILRRESKLIGVDPEVAIRALHLVGDGMRNNEIVRELNLQPALVSKILRVIRRSAADWDGRPTVEGLLA